MSDDENSEVIAAANDKPLNTISNSEFPDSSDQDYVRSSRQLHVQS